MKLASMDLEKDNRPSVNEGLDASGSIEGKSSSMAAQDTEDDEPRRYIDTAQDLLDHAVELEAREGMSDHVVSLYEGALAMGEELSSSRLHYLRQKLADHYVRDGRPAKALPLYLKSEAPASVTPDRALIIANLAREVGNEKAYRAYKARSREAPQRDYIELMESAKSYERNHKFLEASALYQRIIEEAEVPRKLKGKAHMNLAFCLRVLKRYEDAIEEAELAQKFGVKLDPGFNVLLHMRN